MDEQDPFLKPGTLWTSLLERTAQARRCGAIQSIPTRSEIIEQSGVEFQVRIITALAEKEAAKAAQPNANPFLPYDPVLFVAEISPTHVALLNKFNVVEHHLLIVTRAFENQQTQLTHKDCEALLIALTEIDGLAFYNAGPGAGASQPHKHWQLIPLPESTGFRLPIEPLLRFVQMAGATGIVPRLPFRHAYASMDPGWTDPRKVSGASFLACYHELLRVAGLSVDAAVGSHAPTAPYNFLVTRKWMLLVPRSEECFEGISINALGFAGALLVKDATQFALLRNHGPMTALQRVALPRES
jgi:sulfate adenylyltransferase (ADP) / ATP adenylyltransferase